MTFCPASTSVSVRSRGTRPHDVTSHNGTQCFQSNSGTLEQVVSERGPAAWSNSLLRTVGAVSDGSHVIFAGEEKALGGKRFALDAWRLAIMDFEEQETHFGQ